ncbi:hypothetical protein CALVIDRAFT_568613 [Calocera viscosa TUFC12733]|uniref:Uncharacterized protein n=1 Tax=Calocera viscosa (strain TUFC12733) TaxID=1330018 RepID=A0A167GUY4_CALVF|nr:hypothetical protein CALVIDRAFT_568613 [Calocera viscosa TUFC12733]
MQAAEKGEEMWKKGKKLRKAKEPEDNEDKDEDEDDEDKDEDEDDEAELEVLQKEAEDDLMKSKQLVIAAKERRVDAKGSVRNTLVHLKEEQNALLHQSYPSLEERIQKREELMKERRRTLEQLDRLQSSAGRRARGAQRI